MSADLEDLKRQAIEATAEAVSAKSAYEAAVAKSRALCDAYVAANSPLKPGDIIELNKVRRQYRIESMRADDWQFSGRCHAEPRARFTATRLRRDGAEGVTANLREAERPDLYTVIERAAEAIA